MLGFCANYDVSSDAGTSLKPNPLSRLIVYTLSISFGLEVVKIDFSFRNVLGQEGWVEYWRLSIAQGVKQVDPLSCIFNLVIDWGLALDPLLGYKLGQVLLSHLAFANDVVLIASTKAGLQWQITSFPRTWHSWGST